MTDTQDGGWIPCRRCKGAGVYSWAEGHSGPCFLCNGTGDGRIRDWSGVGPRRKYTKRRGSSVPPVTPRETLPAPIPTPPTIVTEYKDITKMDMQTPMGAAEHLAAALAALSTSAPIDEARVRGIFHEEMATELRPIRTAVSDANDTLTMLRRMAEEIRDSVPRRLEIVFQDRSSELPAMRHSRTEVLLQIVAQGLPALIVGPAGSGKTTAAEQVAVALDFPFYMQGAATGAHEFLGYVNAYGHYVSTPFRQAFEHGGVFLADEIDGSDPAALLVINAALANGHMAFPDVVTPVVRHADFRMIAAANTFGTGADRIYVGRSQLDGATLDRFAFLDWPYDEALERNIACNDTWCSLVRRVRDAVSRLSIRHVVSPRASIMGARLLASGMEQDTVERLLIWKGLTDQDVRRIRESVV